MTTPSNPPTRVTVEELRNTVVVDQAAPNNVYVSAAAFSKQTALLYSDGPPWTVVVDVGN
jgi:hypothetical protein